ncbi:MAG: M20/M25/M40 family metallo-hydrolase [Acidobacteria bacterium]|nr:M20/M25/M40 family metallo-hydrolase [Acidobacteriota bacterium]
MLDVVSFARSLIDIDSTTGRETAVIALVEEQLQRLGYRVDRQMVTADRHNLFAYDQPPDVVFSTHMDCVPPYVSSQERGGRLYGRGSCDAKGILSAQLAAVERLRASGVRTAGLLFVVGEERGSDGARVAARAVEALASWLPPSGGRFLIDGEPTDNTLVAATRGIVRLKLVARGRAMHSSFPELGDSAIEKLVDALATLRGIEWPADPTLGVTHYTVGLISGGVAPNVVPARAEAEVLVRTVGDAGVVRALVRRSLPGIEVEDVLEVPPVTFEVVDGFETATFPFTTDSPFLRGWGRLLLMGPGDPRVAHTDEEHVEIAELHRAVDLYERLAKKLLGSSA